MKRALVVAKRTSWHRFVEEARDPHVLDLLRRNDPTVARMRAAHEAHAAAAREVDRCLEVLGFEIARVEDPRVEFDASAADVVITVGGDGTLLTASHHVGQTPVLGVNSAPGHSVGFFCGADERTIEATLERLQTGALDGVTLTRMSVEKNGVPLSRRVLNDALFCHASPAATSRYIFELGDIVEEQKSSGFWIGPAAGSTAAQRSAGGDVLPLDASDVQLIVREPYLMSATKRDPTSALCLDELPSMRLLRRILHAGERLTVRSKMHDALLFLDGPGERKTVTLGDVLCFSASDEPLRLLGITARRERC